MPASRWQPAYVGIGSNLDDPERQVAHACAALAALPLCSALSVSSAYRTAPMGPQDQPWFVNAVAGMLTQMSALALLDALQSIELHFGRDRAGERWGPRVIDLDLLLFGKSRHDSASLQLPHPGLETRNFVLLPLAEIASDALLPDGRRVGALADGLPVNGISRIGALSW